jgi:hypothetical protein
MVLRFPRSPLESLLSASPVDLFAVLQLPFFQGKLSAPSNVLAFSVLKVGSYSEDRRKSKFGMKWPISISRPVVQDPEQFRNFNDRSSPVIPEIQRPATSLHPAYNKEAYPAPPVPAPASSRYSEVSNMTRF